MRFAFVGILFFIIAHQCVLSFGFPSKALCAVRRSCSYLEMKADRQLEMLVTAQNVRQLSFVDIGDICNLHSAFFSPKCTNIFQLILLNMQIFYFSAVKLIFPSIYGYSMLGLRLPGSRQLVGCVEVSLQSCSGSLGDLRLRPLTARRKESVRLAPYLCNLLIDERFRRRGFGRLLVESCIQHAREGGFDTLSLHVERESLAALCLYVACGFELMAALPAKSSKTSYSDTLFLTKHLYSQINAS
eukprot:scaffold2352_cov153-Ochromonas_danica.AAC.13